VPYGDLLQEGAGVRQCPETMSGAVTGSPPPTGLGLVVPIKETSKQRGYT